jgi:hypothetical protein
MGKNSLVAVVAEHQTRFLCDGEQGGCSSVVVVVVVVVVVGGGGVVVVAPSTDILVDAVEKEYFQTKQDEAIYCSTNHSSYFTLVLLYCIDGQ